MRSPYSLCVCKRIPLIVARQRLGEPVPAATNTQAAIDELLNTSYSMWSVSTQRKVGD
jgi:hypothetical protein